MIKRMYTSFMHGPIFVVVFGMIFFGIGGGLTYQQYTFAKQSTQVQGEVTGYTMGSCDDDGCSYKSVVRFETLDGKTKSYTTRFSSNPPAYDVGETVTVFYSLENQGKAIIKGEGIVFRIIFMSIGGIIILFGVGFNVANVRNSYLIEE